MRLGGVAGMRLPAPSPFEGMQKKSFIDPRTDVVSRPSGALPAYLLQGREEMLLEIYDEIFFCFHVPNQAASWSANLWFEAWGA